MANAQDVQSEACAGLLQRVLDEDVEALLGRGRHERWVEILRDCTASGWPALACVIGAGVLGLWNAAGQVWPEAAEQRCRNHKLRKVVEVAPL